MQVSCVTRDYANPIPQLSSHRIASHLCDGSFDVTRHVVTGYLHILWHSVTVWIWAVFSVTSGSLSFYGRLRASQFLRPRAAGLRRWWQGRMARVACFMLLLYWFWDLKSSLYRKYYNCNYVCVWACDYWRKSAIKNQIVIANYRTYALKSTFLFRWDLYRTYIFVLLIRNKSPFLRKNNNLRFFNEHTKNRRQIKLYCYV